MNYDEVYAKVVEIVKDILDNDALELNKESSQENTEGWDSLASINIIAAVQEDFNIKLTFNETLSIKNLDELVLIVLKKNNN